mgnify:CR=1 FL=1
MTFAFPSFEQINTVIIKYITKSEMRSLSSYVQCHVFDVQYIYKWITMASRSPEAIILYTWVERYRMEWCFFDNETTQWQGKVSKPQHSYLKPKALTTNHNTFMTLYNGLPKLPNVETTMYLCCFYSMYRIYSLIRHTRLWDAP